MTGTDIPPQAITAHDAYWRVKEAGEPPPFDSLPLKLQQCWAAAAEAVAAAGGLHAIGRLDRLAAAHRGTPWEGAYEAAAAALREELKIAEDGRTA